MQTFVFNLINSLQMIID